MRVLFVVNPEKTIFLSMVTVAWALRAAGHEVRFASRPGFASTITQAGLTAVPVGRDQDQGRRLAAGGVTAETLEATRAGLGIPWDVAENPAAGRWDDLLRGYTEAVRYAFKPENFPIIADLVDYARHWRPDLVIWEPLTFAGPIAAEACGAVHARILWSLDVFGVTREQFLRHRSARPAADRTDPLADWLGGYARKYGFDFSERLITGHFTIDQLPASLRLAADLDYVPARFVPYGGPAAVPQWVRTASPRPRIALTFGTTATDSFDGYALDVQRILDALSDLDVEVEVVATIAEREQARLSRVPANTRLVSYVPLHVLAPTCAVAIHHGGFGTLNTFAMHAVPQIVLPYHFDEPLFAARYAAQGAGLVIDARADGAGARIRDAVVRLLADPGVAARAVALRDEMTAMPSPNDVAGHLEDRATRMRR